MIAPLARFIDWSVLQQIGCLPLHAGWCRDWKSVGKTTYDRAAEQTPEPVAGAGCPVRLPPLAAFFYISAVSKTSAKLLTLPRHWLNSTLASDSTVIRRERFLLSAAIIVLELVPGDPWLVRSSAELH